MPKRATRRPSPPPKPRYAQTNRIGMSIAACIGIFIAFGILVIEPTDRMPDDMSGLVRFTALLVTTWLTVKLVRHINRRV